MEDDSPWGASVDLPPLPSLRSSSPKLPSFSASSTVATSSSNSWGDDGGWGGATDDYSMNFTPSSTTSTTSNDFIPSKLTESSSDTLDGGWGGSSSSPELPPIVRLSAHSNEPTEDLAVSILSLGPASSQPPSSPPASGFAPSPTFDSAVQLPSLDSPPAASRELEDDVAPKEEETDDWGGHGRSPTLPPIIVESSSPVSTRDRGWGNEEEWTPAELPPPLPSFGSSFSSAKKVEDRSGEEEGWGGGGGDSWGGAPGGYGADAGVEDEVGGGRNGEWPSETTEEEMYQGKSIPASLVDGIKENSREFSDSNWKAGEDSWDVSELQDHLPGVTSLLSTLLTPPRLPPRSSITIDTPLPDLFKQTSTLYPAFQHGLDQTALRTAKTLRGTSSPEYRNARFGKSSRNRGTTVVDLESGEGYDPETGLGIPVNESKAIGHAGDEFDLDAPSTTNTTPTKSSWWNRSASEPPKPNSVPKALVAKKDEVMPAGKVDEVEPPAASGFGRIFGRLGRKTSPAVSPRASSEAQERPTQSEEHEDVDGPIGKIAQTKIEAQRMDDALGNIFGDAPRKTTVPAAFVPKIPSPVDVIPDDFLVSRGPPQSKTIRPATRKVKKTDPFDPFGDDDEDEPVVVQPIAPSASVPIIARPTSSASILRALSPPLAPSSRPISPALQPISPPPPAQVASFTPLAAPQPRITSPLSTMTPSQEDDSFDAFFTSIANSTQKQSSVSPASYSSPVIASSSRAAAPSPPIRTPTLSPPPRTTSVPTPTITSSSNVRTSRPPSRTGSASPGFFAPPPPPLQPVSRGFSIPPPPSSSSPVSGIPNLAPFVTSTAPLKPVAPPAAGKGGPLSMDDLSFFESL